MWGKVNCGPRSPGKPSFCAKSGERASTAASNGELRHRRRLPAEGHQHDLRGNAETERHDAAAEAAGDDDVVVHADVAVDETRARRRDRRPAEQADLAAMGMPGELQRH